MADFLAPSRALARTSLYLIAQRRPLTWIKRRTRRLQTAFAVPRRTALAQAVSDWSYFQPRAAH